MKAKTHNIEIKFDIEPKNILLARAQAFFSPEILQPGNEGVK